MQSRHGQYCEEGPVRSAFLKFYLLIGLVGTTLRMLLTGYIKQTEHGLCRPLKFPV